MPQLTDRALRRLRVGAEGLLIISILGIAVPAITGHHDADPERTTVTDRLTHLPTPAGFSSDPDEARRSASVQSELGSPDPDVQVTTSGTTVVAYNVGEHRTAATAWSVTLPASDKVGLERACTELQAEMTRLNDTFDGSMDASRVREGCLSPYQPDVAENAILPAAGVSGAYSWGAIRSVTADGRLGLHLTVVYSGFVR